MDKIFQVPATITQIKTMSQWLRLNIDTQETLKVEQMQHLFDMYNKLGWMSFAVRQIEVEDVIELPPLKSYKHKSPSRRLRDVLFLNWQKDPAGYDDFEGYYEYIIERLIETWKQRLD